MSKLAKQGKGIILMHDFQKHTGEALPTLLARLKAERLQGRGDEGEDEAADPAAIRRSFLKDTKLPTVSSRPVSSVVQTISTN